MKTILFQGDSITDVGRNRENELSFGEGYPLMTVGALSCKYPEEYRFVNKGISGNRVVDLYARWKQDCLNIKPDYISILIGVNDVWHDLGCTNEPNGVEADKYEKVYDMLLEETLRKLPGVKIMLMEPYLLHGPATDDKWDVFSSEVALRREAANRLAEKYGLPILPLQSILDEALKKAPASYWSADGVHPTKAGHKIISDAWIDMFEKLLK